MPADLRHSVFRRLHGGGAGDHAGAAVIHFDDQAEADGTNLHAGPDTYATLGKLLADRL